MPRRFALLLGATLAVSFGCLGCDHDSELAAMAYLGAYAGDPTVFEAVKGEWRANEIDNLVAKFVMTTDRKIEFWATSSIDGALSFEGTYTQSQGGVTADLQGKGYGDNQTRTMALDLAGPDTDGKLSGTATYTWGEATYEGSVTLTPAGED